MILRQVPECLNMLKIMLSVEPVISPRAPAIRRRMDPLMLLRELTKPVHVQIYPSLIGLLQWRCLLGIKTRPIERMSIARGATTGEIYHLSPIIYVLSCEAYGLDSAELNGLKMWMRKLRRTFYTEVVVDTPRFRLPFLQTIIRFGKDEQMLSLNDRSFFVVVDLPFPICARFVSSRVCSSAFHPSDIAAQIMFCMVNDFIPLSELGVKNLCLAAGSKRCNRGFG